MALSISQWERQTLLVKAMGSPATWLISLKPPLVRGSYIVRSVPLVEVGPLRQLLAPTARTIRSQLARLLAESLLSVDAPPIPSLANSRTHERRVGKACVRTCISRW